jgi:hypothetical protein
MALYAVDFHFLFTNHSEQMVPLKFDTREFSFVDNVGRSYACGVCDVTGGVLENVDRAVPAAEMSDFWLCCGPGEPFDEQVSEAVLSVQGISTLGPASWRIDVPH